MLTCCRVEGTLWFVLFIILTSTAAELYLPLVLPSSVAPSLSLPSIPPYLYVPLTVSPFPPPSLPPFLPPSLPTPLCPSLPTYSPPYLPPSLPPYLLPSLPPSIPRCWRSPRWYSMECRRNTTSTVGSPSSPSTTQHKRSKLLACLQRLVIFTDHMNIM